MEEPMKTPNTQEKKKMVVKIGAGAGGGLGAVVLLGGVLATAAFASAFMFRGNGKDHRRRHRNPPRENPSKGAIKEVENDDDGDFQVSTESLKLDEKDRCETNSSDEILCSISPRNLEKDDGLIIVDHKGSPFLEEKSPPELQNILPEDGEIVVEKCEEVIQGAEMDLSEDCSNQEAMSAVDSLREFTVSKSHSEDCGKTLQPVLESPVIEHQNLDHEKEDEGTREDLVEPYEVKFIEEQCDQSDNHLIDLIEEKDGNVFIPFENKEENVAATHPTEEILAGMVSEDVEVKNEEVANENIKKGVEEELITHEKDEAARDGILGEEEGGESDALLRNLNGEREENISIPHEKKEENECITNPTEDILAVIVEGVSEVTEEEVAEENIKKGIEEELISPDQDTEISKDGANEVVLDSLELVENGPPIEFPEIQLKDQSHEVEGNIKNGVVGEFIFHENVEAVEDDIAEDEIKDFIHEDVSSDETVEDSSVESGDSSNESNSEAIWPAESLDFQQPKHISHEVEKKIQEDKTVEEGDDNHQTIVDEPSVEPHKSRAEEDDRELPGGNGDSEEDYIKKLVLEMGMMKDRPTNPTQRRVVIGALSLLSSLSCSWLLGLSFVKLCLIVFLTMAMWEIHG